MFTSPRRLLVLDDDPTGSQCVSKVQVAFEEDAALIATTLEEPGSTCFVLTNTRALDEAEAIAKNQRILAGVLAERGAEGLHLVSRSDSTLRGHVIAEPNALADTLAEAGTETDAFLFCPAMLEAGRFTEDNIHYAVVDGHPVPVEDTDFARDATFGYKTSDLAAFLEEKSGGAIAATDVITLSLAEIREGGVETVKEKLAGACNRQWVIINATDYSDMETVADAVTQLEAAGKVFITRCGPSFVRPLAGQKSAKVLRPESISLDKNRLPHGLLVVGSHVGLTTDQLAEVKASSGLAEFELQVEKLLDPENRAHHLDEIVEAVRTRLNARDCVIYTSRTLVSTDDPSESLAIARKVSDAVVEVVQRVRSVRPAWVIAKGGITSHEVAHKGLDIRLARVEGQFFPGQISLFTPQDAPVEVLGTPYVVFPGNVGGRTALAEVVTRLKSAA